MDVMDRDVLFNSMVGPNFFKKTVTVWGLLEASGEVTVMVQI